MNAQHVLLETLATKQQRTAVLFRCMTAIGPMSTTSREQAEVFDSEAAAKACPASWHALSFYRAVPIESVDAIVAEITGSANA